MNEKDVIETFRESRSEEAFAELTRRYAGMVYAVAKRRLANSALAEDITQIVFIRLAKAFPKVRNHAELAAWLHRTTVNVTIDTWRSESRRRNREQQAVIMEPATAENHTREVISPQLDEALNQLNDDDRQALLLRFFGQKTMRDVGAAMGVSEDAAKMRISRALERLRTQLGVRGAACTGAVLATIMVGHSVEAAPGKLMARLAAIKVPVTAATGGLFGVWLGISKWKLVAGAVAGGLILAGIIYQVRSRIVPVPKEELAEIQTNPVAKMTASTGRRRVEADGLDAEGATLSRVKMIFHVVDSETGAELAGTEIHFAYFGATGEDEGQDMVTDGRGIAAIPEPDDPGKNRGMSVYAISGNHVPKGVGFDRDVPEDYTIKLDPALTASGVVIDEQGFPVAGVTITMPGEGVKPGENYCVDYHYCSVVSGDDGRWSFNYVPKGNAITFILKKEGYVVTFAGMPSGKVDLSKLVLVVERGFTVTGQVRDRQGRPIANARVRTADRNNQLERSTKTDENGIYTLAGVAGEVATGGSYTSPELRTNIDGSIVVSGASGQGPLHARLRVDVEHYAPQVMSVDLVKTTNVVNFTLLPGNIFRGSVVDEAGNPISNAIVRTGFDFKDQIDRQHDWLTQTDINGQFEWDSAPVGEISYWIDADGFEAIRGMVITADGSNHKITLTAAAKK